MNRVIWILALAACQPTLLHPEALQGIDGRGLFAENSDAARALAERIAFDHLKEMPSRVPALDELPTRNVSIRQGRAHVRIDQTVDGVPVFGAQSIVHLDAEGRMEAMTDRWHRDLHVDTQPHLDRKDAIDRVLAREGVLTEDPQTDLFVMRHKGTDHLVWRVRMEQLDGTERSSIPVNFIDAHSGDVVWRYDDLQSASTGHATTDYNGEIAFPVESEGGQWHLKSYDDGAGTYDVSGYSGTLSSSRLFDVTAPSVDAFSDEVALDAHFGAVQTMSYFAAVHGRNGVNGFGGPNLHDGVTVSAVHYGSNLVNAYWTGSAMVYGDGDGSLSGPLVALDIAAHEMTHGVTSNTAGLIYSGESGALNEGMSDIFGAVVEQYVKGDGAARWTLAEDCWTPRTTGDATRYMANPTQDYSSRDHYTTRYTGSSDNGGVHWNSGIANLAFYLLVEGGTHPNPARSVTSVTGIGWDDAADIYYAALTEYMTPSTDFQGARTATLQAATAQFGATSPQVAAVANSWAEVGVGSPVSNDGGSDGPDAVEDAGDDYLDVTNLSGAQGASVDHVLTVPEGATDLIVRMSGGTGDADLYVNRGALGSDASYVCRPYKGGNDELCEIAAPEAGDWHFTVRGYSTFAGVQLTASFVAPVVVPPAPEPIDETVAGAKGSEATYQIEVPHDAERLVVRTTGGTGDLDLYVKQGTVVTQQAWDCRPYASGNSETCTMDARAQGTWSILVHGWSEFSGARLEAFVE